MVEPRDKCVINTVLEANPLISPKLVNCDYGILTKENLVNLKCNIYADSTQPPAKILVLSKGNEHFKGDCPQLSNNLSQTLLLIRNRSKNKVQLINVENCAVAPLTKKHKSTLPELNQETEFRVKVKNLNRSFGSKKAMRVNNISMRLDLNNSVKEDDIKETVAGIEVLAKDIAGNVNDNFDKTILELIPPCNRDAKSAEEVYQLHDLISQTELNTLEEAAKFLLDNPPTEQDAKHSFFLHAMFYQLGKNPPLLKAQILLYTCSLVKFTNMNIPELRGKTATNTICSYSSFVANKILKNFTVQSEGVRTRPPYFKDKAVCYILVLLLLINNYTINMEILSTCIKGYGQKKITQLARAVGVVPKGTGASKVYRLTVPLPPLPAIAKRRVT